MLNFTFAQHLLCISNAQNKHAAGKSATIYHRHAYVAAIDDLCLK